MERVKGRVEIFCAVERSGAARKILPDLDARKVSPDNVGRGSPAGVSLGDFPFATMPGGS